MGLRIYHGVFAILMFQLRVQVLGDDAAPVPEIPQTGGDAPSIDITPPVTGGNTGSTPSKDDIYLDKVCRNITSDIVSSFRNPSYPAKEKDAVICHHVVVPQEGYCGLRVEFMEATFAPPLQGCSTDTFQILNSVDSPSVIQCGFMAGYQFTVRVRPGKRVTLLVTSQSESSWSVKLTQMQCAGVKVAEALLPKECGVPGDPASALRNDVEDIKVIEPLELLKQQKSPLKYGDLREPELLLWKSILDYKSNLRIVNGNETGVNEFPWQVLLLAGGKPFCGGSLISDSFVLTAGHCAAILNSLPSLASLVVVDLGDHDLTSITESRNRVYYVEKVIPNIQHDVVLSDIALLKLKKKVEFTTAIAPICLPRGLPKDTSFDGQAAVTSGWGKTSDGSVISPVLRKADLNIVPLEVCRQLWELVGIGGGEMIQDSMICAGGGLVGPCNGDSGGPLMVKDPLTGRYSLIGVTSFGALRGCALEGVPTVFTRVTAFVDWILLNIAEI